MFDVNKLGELVNFFVGGGGGIFQKLCIYQDNGASLISRFAIYILYKTCVDTFIYVNPPTIAALQWQVALVVKISKLPVLTVDPNVHTEIFFTGFDCHFDHPQQYKTMFLPVKDGRLILTHKCTAHKV